MTGTNIVSQTKVLAALQKLDGQIYDLKREMRDKPAYIADLLQQFEAKKSNLKILEETYKTVQVKRNSLETDLKSKEAATAKANAQLSDIKTNKEYTAKLSEIESIKADQSILEEKILMSYDEADAAKVQIEKEKAMVAEEEKHFLAKKKEVDDSIKVIEERVNALTAQRQQILPEVDKQILARYEKIIANKDGRAVMAVHNGSCGGCFVTLPHQVINEIKMHEHIVFCEQCGVILYLEEDLS